ncbi:hypothetical protein ACHAP9_003616 [Verticillium nonalfalfae]
MMRLLTCSALVALPLTLAISIRSTDVWDIATDIQGPERLNGVSYQEDVLVTFGDYQYVTFYSTTPAGYNNHHVNLGRRRIEPSVEPWEYLAFTDYVQRTWSKSAINPSGLLGPDLYDPRGKLAADASGEYVIALLPVAATSETRIYVASTREKFRHWVLLTSIPNTSTEPLYDQVRLREYDVLSVFVRQAGSYPDRMLQVWDFKLEL